MRLAFAGTVLSLMAAVACSSSSSSSSSTNNGADGGGSRQPLTVRFTSMYSLYDGVQVYTVPATVDGVQNATWSVSDPTLASIGPLTTESPSCGDALITTKGVGTVTVTATAPDGRTGSAPLTITAAPAQGAYAVGVQRALYGEANAATGSGQPCINCHNDSSDIKHTPQQIGGFSDAQLRNLIFHGQIPDGFPALTKSLPTGWSQMHQWTATDEEQDGLVVLVRSLPPAAGGSADFARDPSVAPACQEMNVPDDDASAPVVDASAPIVDADPGNFAGQYTCMLNATATVKAAGTTQTKTIPANWGLSTTEMGTAVSDSFLGEGGVICTVHFTDRGTGIADITTNQECVLQLNIGFPVTVTLAFTPGATTTRTSATSVEMNLPFNLTATDGIATGAGTMTGPCTK